MPARGVARVLLVEADILRARGVGPGRIRGRPRVGRRPLPAKHLDAPVVRAGEFILYPYIASQVGLVFVWAVGVVQRPVPRRAGERGGLLRGAAVSGEAGVQGRRNPQLPAGGSGAVPVVRSADGLALGQRLPDIDAGTGTAAPRAAHRMLLATCTCVRMCCCPGWFDSSPRTGVDPAPTPSRARWRRSLFVYGQSRRWSSAEGPGGRSLRLSEQFAPGRRSRRP